MQSDLFVYLRQGTYFLDSTLELSPTDSGYNGYYVHYMTYPQDSGLAVLHAGVEVPGWTLSDAGKNIWSATLPAGINDLRQLYIGTDPAGPMDRMNTTNTGSGLSGTVTATSYGYTTTDPTVQAWASVAQQAQSDVEFLYTGLGSSWTECRLRVQNFTALPGGSTAIYMQEPGWTLAVNRPYGQGEHGGPASIQNVYALLSNSTPGQYYFNSAIRTVYYVPRPQDDMSTAVVIAPSLDVLVRVTGDRDAQPAINPVHHVTFENLAFAYAGWLEPNSGIGYVDMQSAFRVVNASSDGPDDMMWTPVPGNVQMHTVQNVTVKGCTFTHLGATALYADQGSQSVAILNNTFRDISCGGVYLGQVDDANLTDASRINAHMLVQDNLFDGIPNEFHDCAALLGGFLVNATFDHNSILNNANTGISLGWGWSRDDATNSGYNTISNNYIYGSNWLLEDGGSIYALNPQPNSIMINNYISNQRKLYGALYTDDGSAYWRITGNVVHDVPEWLHIWTSTIHDEQVDNNWSDQTYQIVAGTRITMVNNTFITSGQPWPQPAQDVINNAGTYAMAGPKP